MAITAAHTLIYTDDPAATRAFLRDVLGFPFVSDAGSSDPGADAGPVEEQWLIFGTGPSELGVHPTRSEWEGKVYESPRHHQIAFMCDDLDATIAELTAKGATFKSEPRDEGYGITVMFEVPGADDIMLYQPRHTTAYNL